MLKTTHFCTKCNFLMGENEVPVKGRLDALEDRIDALIEEWTTTLYNTLSDPILEEQLKYLSDQQRQVINKFLESKALPEKVDAYFVDAVNALLEDFEPVSIPAAELIDKLDAFGPCDVDTAMLITSFGGGRVYLTATMPVVAETGE